MSIRLSRLATALLVVAAVLLMPGRGWAIYDVLGPSKDEWGLKYEVQVNDAGGDTVTVVFTLADEGRLKPLSSIELFAFSKETDNQGGHSYDVKEPIELKATRDGRQAGQVRMRKEFLNRAQIRILTKMVDGRLQQPGYAAYEVPISKFMKKRLSENRAGQGGQSPFPPKAPEDGTVPDGSQTGSKAPAAAAPRTLPPAAPPASKLAK